MGDLTILYISANAMPDHWIKYQWGILRNAVCGNPIICLTRKPIGLGDQEILDTYPKSYWNIYRQMRIGAEAAKTKYVAMAEDDVLYTKEHFHEFRPKDNEVSYNRSRWSLFVWENRPMYCLRQRISNCTMIAPRDYFIDAIAERERRWPNGYKHDSVVGEVGRRIVEKNLDVPYRNMVEWYCSNPVVQLNHVDGTDERQRTKWKRHGQIKAWDIPYWGKASEIVKEYNGEH